MRFVVNVLGTTFVVSALGVFLSGYTLPALVMLISGAGFLMYGLREKS